MSNAITKTNGNGAAGATDIMAYAGGLTREQVQLVKTTVITGGTRPVSDNELALFLTICNRRGLDAFSGQIYGIMRKSKEKSGEWVEKLVVQVGIDGYRLLAERTGKYEGVVGPLWCGDDGQWVDVWLSDKPPAAAKVGVYRTGCREPFWGVVTFREFAQTYDGKPMGKWKDMPATMLAKCAESAAIRKAFPQAVGGVTTPEMAGADTELIGASVPATEHSVMSAGGEAGEVETFARLLELYATGIVSVVSDTWDYFRVLTKVLPALKQRIMERPGKLVVRPDSGDPVKIICGDPGAPAGTPENLGTFEVLWRLFGGTINDKGFRVLDPHIGTIYGDGITPERAEAICEELVDQGFVPAMVFGVGSFTYQLQTRDIHGLAMKATYVEIGGQGREIFKAPKTKGGVSKGSARGLLAVSELPGGRFALMQRAAWEDVLDCSFEPVFEDGRLVRRECLAGIRARAQQEA